MLQSTQLFIQRRQEYTTNKLSLRDVTNIGGGKKNQCFLNATSERDRKHGVALASGWLVGPFDDSNGSFEVFAHFWNTTMTGYNFDTTPFPEINFEYVSDISLMAFIMKNDRKLFSFVPSSLCYKNNSFFLVDENTDGTLRSSVIEDLTTETLFSRKFKTF